MRIKENITVIIIILIMIVGVVYAVITNTTHDDALYTPIEESNISIPEIEIAGPPAPAQDPELNTEPEITLEPAAEKYERKETDKLSVMKQEISYLQSQINLINSTKDGIILLGYENQEILDVFDEDIKIYQSHIEYYAYLIGQIELIRFTASATDFPVATEIWQYLKAQGMNDYVIAGIMGNLMAEVGGHTLNINYTLYDSTYQYYGMCQWALKYCPSIEGKNLNEQLEYLMQSIESAFKHYGKNYAANFTYNDFLNLKNEKEAALAFAKVYERCASFSYTKRQDNATKAYQYFVG